MTAPLPRDARALARLPNWLGDAVMALPAVEALEQHLRAEGSLSLVLPRAFAPLFSAHLPTARLLAPEDDWRGHDTAFLFTNSFRSAWYALRARIPRRVGQARELRGLLLTDCYTPEEHTAYVFGTVAEAVRLVSGGPPPPPVLAFQWSYFESSNSINDTVRTIMSSGKFPVSPALQSIPFAASYRAGAAGVVVWDCPI